MWNLFLLFVYQLNFQFPTLFYFCKFSPGPHKCPNTLAGLLYALCSCTSGHHHHLVVVFWSPQWFSGHHIGSFELPSYHTLKFDPPFDFKHPGSHLNQPLKLVPVSEFFQVSKSLFCSLLLILWSIFAFSSLFKLV